jgi:hypothetical protein
MFKLKYIQVKDDNKANSPILRVNKQAAMVNHTG